MKFGGDTFQREYGVELQLRFEVGKGQAGSGVGVEVRGQLLYVGGGQRESHGMGMSPVTREDATAGFQRVKQVEGWNGAARAVRLLAIA